MISAAAFVAALDRHGVELQTGVPCSCLGGPIAEFTRRGTYVPAANEGAAVALAAGAWAGGSRAAVLAQNSGLGNMINPLTSLVMPYRLPLLAVMSLRGWPDPDADEPQHRVMGTTTHRLLDSLGVKNWTLRCAAVDADDVVDAAMRETRTGRPAFILVPKGAVGAADPRPDIARDGVTRRDALKLVVERLPDALLVATTGYTSRELFQLADCERFFYMQGSMGHACAFGLGVALARQDHRPVVVLDGDGAALMHLGSMSTIGMVAPSQLIHVIFDNGCYESTGGQPTTASTVSFPDVGAAVSYRTAVECRRQGDIADALDRAAATPGPHLLVVKTAGGAGTVPPRATSALTAPQIHARFAVAARAS